jgi:hypothetical protein
VTRRPSRAEELVRERDRLAAEQREIDYWRVRCRLGEKPGVWSFLRVIAFRHHDRFEPFPPAVSRGFYDYLGTLIDSLRIRIAEIDAQLAAMEVHDA